MESSFVKLQHPWHHHYISLTTKLSSRSFRADGRDQQANHNDPLEAGKTEGNTNVLDLYILFEQFAEMLGYKSTEPNILWLHLRGNI